MKRGRKRTVVKKGATAGVWTAVSDSENGFVLMRCECGKERYVKANIIQRLTRCGQCAMKARFGAVRDTAVFLYRKGFTLREIGELTGKSFQAVQSILDAAGEPRRKGSPFKFALDIPRAQALLDSGMSGKEVAAAMGVCVSVLLRTAKAAGIDVKASNRRKTEGKWIGQKNGRLTVTAIERSKNERGRWETIFVCRCDCGKEHRVSVCNFARTKSCGCLGSEYVELLRSGAFTPCKGEKLVRAS